MTALTRDQPQKMEDTPISPANVPHPSSHNAATVLTSLLISKHLSLTTLTATLFDLLLISSTIPRDNKGENIVRKQQCTCLLTLFDTKFEWQGSSLGCCILKPRPPFDLRPLAALQQKGAATYLLEACQDRGSC